MCNKIAQTPFVSFVIPVYNVAAYISKCLDSIIYQSFGLWEAVVVDDGSSDKSALICDEYAKRDSRVRVYHKANGGVSSARNYALDKVVGEWVWFVDSDDYIAENSLSILYDIVSKIACDTVFFGLIDEYDGIVRNTTKDFSQLLNLKKSDFLSQIFCYTNPTMLFQRTIIEKHHIRFSEGLRMAEDLEFQYKYLIWSDRPISIKERLYIYRHREGSAMTNLNTNSNNLNDSLVVLENLLLYVKQHNIKEEIWLSMRIRMLIKGCLQSAQKESKVEIDDFKMKISHIVKSYRSIGYNHIVDNTIRIAMVNIRLYFVLLQLYYYIHNK